MGTSDHRSDSDAGLTDDAFLGGTVRLLQPASGHRSGLDAVLLAASIPARSGDTVLDMGCGAGAAALCVLARVPETRAILLDSDAAMLGIAGQNIARNGFGERASTRCHDLDTRGGVAAAGIPQGGISHAFANPPFFDSGAVRLSPEAGKQDAHIAGASRADSFARWASFAAGALGRSGTFTAIHRADALNDVLAALAGRFGAVTVTPVHPRAGVDAIRIIVAGTKGSRAPMRLGAGLVLHPPSGRGYLPGVDAVLRAPLALPAGVAATK